VTDWEDIGRDVFAHYAAGVKGALLAEYRCRKRGCLLLHVWQTPMGPEFFAPGGRVSDRYELAHQFDWPGLGRQVSDKSGDRAHRLNDPVIAQKWLWLLCDHVKEAVWVRDIRRELTSQPGKPTKILLPRDTPGRTLPGQADHDIP
jgi:hypothetical protein